MIHRIAAVIVLTLWLVALSATWAQVSKSADTFRVEYTLKTPRGRDPVLGGARDTVFFVSCALKA